MRRVLLLIVVLAAYAAVLGYARGLGTPAAFDPLAPRPHAIERLIVAQRYAEALPLAIALRDNYPSEPIVAFWVATASSGLERWQAAADGWEAFVRISPAPASACPSLPQAYERLGAAERALDAYTRCADFDASDPARHLDLGAALERAGRLDAARVQYRRAAELDPHDPALSAGGRGLSRASGTASAGARGFSRADGR
jgi:tetratricopeptide (TPR) repeat protein